MRNRYVPSRSRERAVAASHDQPRDSLFWFALLMIGMTALAYCEVQIHSSMDSVSASSIVATEH